MNRMNLLKSTLLALALAGATGPAAAADGTGARIATTVGHWVASQGNAALREIRDDLRKRLPEALKPRLPAPVPAPAHDAKR